MCIYCVVYYHLQEPGLIASDFLQTFWDFGIRSKLIFFSLSPVNFTSEKCTVWRYRASQKTWYRTWFVQSWLFSIRKFEIQINILKEYSFRSNIYVLCIIKIDCVHLKIQPFFPKIRGILFFFFSRMTIRIISNSRFRAVSYFTLFFFGMSACIICKSYAISN